jgi:hypothetical protein
MCQLLTRTGKPCPFSDMGRGLCHLHDPDGTYAGQHPKSRERLLARADVQAVVAGRSLVREEHCTTCKCVRVARTG